MQPHERLLLRMHATLHSIYVYMCACSPCRFASVKVVSFTRLLSSTPLSLRTSSPSCTGLPCAPPLLRYATQSQRACAQTALASCSLIAHKPAAVTVTARQLLAHLLHATRTICMLHLCAPRASLQLGIAELPEAVPEGFAEDEGFLKSVHDLIRDVRDRPRSTSHMPRTIVHARTPIESSLTHPPRADVQPCVLIALQLHIMEGALVCPNCERAYPIHKGIPNMVLAEDEL